MMNWWLMQLRAMVSSGSRCELSCRKWCAPYSIISRNWSDRTSPSSWTTWKFLFVCPDDIVQMISEGVTSVSILHCRQSPERSSHVAGDWAPHWPSYEQLHIRAPVRHSVARVDQQRGSGLYHRGQLQSHEAHDLLRLLHAENQR